VTFTLTHSSALSLLEDVCTDNSIENITFKECISTNRCELVTIVKSTEEFIETLLEKLLLLLHSFKQAIYFKELKCDLQSGESVVLCDFTENYTFVLRDKAQGFLWNKAQATIHL
jgi:hypothetical protein